MKVMNFNYGSIQRNRMSYITILYGQLSDHMLHFICNLLVTNIFSTSDKGINSATARHIIIHVVSVPSEYDELNIWPVSGKQFTVGIVESGFFLYLNISWIYLQVFLVVSCFFYIKTA